MQQVAALPAGKAEQYGVAKGGRVLIGAIGLTRDLGVTVKGILRTDLSAAKDVAPRRGLGEVKHVNVRRMWTQDVARSGRLAIAKIPGGENAANVWTQNLDGTAIVRRLKRLECAVESERHKLAPTPDGGVAAEGDGNLPELDLFADAAKQRMLLGR